MGLDCISYLAGLKPPIHPARYEPGKVVYYCPLHVEYHPSFTVYLNDGHFHCFSAQCQRHGDVIGLIAAYEFHLPQGVITREVYQRYEELGGAALSTTRNKQPLTTRRRAVEKPAATADQQAMFTTLAEF